MADKEIIDLTADDQEVIVLESGDETQERPTKRARRAPPNSDTKGEVAKAVNGAQAGEHDASAENKARKARKPGRKKRKKLTEVGDEDGEIVEVETTEESGSASRDESREQTEVEGQSRDAAGKSTKTKAKDSLVRSLLDRLADAEDLPTARPEDTSRTTNPDSKEKRKKKKKRKRGDSDRERTNTASTNQDSTSNGADASIPSDLFFIDDTPAEIPAEAKLPVPPPKSLSTPASTSAAHDSKDSAVPLLLPAHVAVLDGDGAGEDSLQIIEAPPPDSEDEDYIEYVDYDDDRKAPGVVRYFDDLGDGAEPKSAKIVCKRCGAEGEHKTWNCPVIICLTCGVRNEHGTRSCPISKVCFTCGMKGHINRNCPNRYAGRSRLGGGGFDDCDRCGSSYHQTNECPTLWRMYTYVEEAERLEILAERERKRDLEIGEGGEGYIGPEDWCYNCGDCGHLGDDCQAKAHNHDRPRDPSAFGTYNINTGPFSDAKDPQQRKPGKAASYANRMNEAWGDGYGYVMPLDVGKQGRKKERARMERRAQELQEEDGDDWFANRGASNSRDKGGKGNGTGWSKGSKGGRQNTKISFGDLDRDDGRFDGRDRRERVRYDDLPGPSRETDSIQIRGASRRERERERTDRNDEWDGTIRGAARRQNDYEHDQRRKDRSKDDRRYDNRRRERDRREASPRREPRYRGGYSR